MRFNNQEIAVFKHEGKLCAMQNICPHEGGQLSAGWIEDGAVVCPLHGYKFDLSNRRLHNRRQTQSENF